TVKKIDADCRTGAIGCVDCKKICAQSIERVLEPIRAKRAAIDEKEVEEIVAEGNRCAREEAAESMKRVNEAVFEISCST
ncbi:MAG: tryptophan--tRNA ligase, partial [Hydrogenimonas sp.]|nr:tryptophan--tRNA ligase [Hydrogenimonas sp.]